MKRLTPELVGELQEKYGIRLVHDEYCSIRNKCACAVGFLAVDHAGSIKDADKLFDIAFANHNAVAFGNLAPLINSDVDYLRGLETGFEEFRSESTETDSEVFKQGLEDGKALRPLAVPYEEEED